MKILQGPQRQRGSVRGDQGGLPGGEHGIERIDIDPTCDRFASCRARDRARKVPDHHHSQRRRILHRFRRGALGKGDVETKTAGRGRIGHGSKNSRTNGRLQRVEPTRASPRRHQDSTRKSQFPTPNREASRCRRPRGPRWDEASLEEIERQRRDRGSSRRGLNEATYNGAVSLGWGRGPRRGASREEPNDRGGTEGRRGLNGPLHGGKRFRAPFARRVDQNGRAWRFAGRAPASTERRLQPSPILLKKERQPRPSLLLDWRGRGFRINRADCSMNSLNRSSETAERIPTRALEDIITCVSHLDDWF